MLFVIYWNYQKARGGVYEFKLTMDYIHDTQHFYIIYIFKFKLITFILQIEIFCIEKRVLI